MEVFCFVISQYVRIGIILHLPTKILFQRPATLFAGFDRLPLRVGRGPVYQFNPVTPRSTG